jgi:hypothetical protein
MIPYKFTTGTGTPALTLIGGGVGQSLLGVAATSAEAAAYFIKLWWQGVSPLQTIPVIGTTPPSVTISVGTTGVFQEFNHPLQGGGPLYYAVTKNAADTDDTALTTGGDVVTLFLN